MTFPEGELVSARLFRWRSSAGPCTKG